MIQIDVEVTDEIIPTRNGGKQQVVYVATGGKYPERATLFVDEKTGPLKAGLYVADTLRKNGYAFQLDLFQLSPKGK